MHSSSLRSLKLLMAVAESANWVHPVLLAYAQVRPGHQCMQVTVRGQRSDGLLNVSQMNAVRQTWQNISEVVMGGVRLSVCS